MRYFRDFPAHAVSQFSYIQYIDRNISHRKHSQKQFDLAILLTAESFTERLSVQNYCSPQFLTYFYTYKMTHRSLITLNTMSYKSCWWLRMPKMCSSEVSLSSIAFLSIRKSLCATGTAFKLMKLTCLTNVIAHILSRTSTQRE